MAYTPPNGNSVVFTFTTTGYSPPTNPQFNFGVTGNIGLAGAYVYPTQGMLAPFAGSILPLAGSSAGAVAAGSISPSIFIGAPLVGNTATPAAGTVSASSGVTLTAPLLNILAGQVTATHTAALLGADISSGLSTGHPVIGSYDYLWGQSLASTSGGVGTAVAYQLAGVAQQTTTGVSLGARFGPLLSVSQATAPGSLGLTISIATLGATAVAAEAGILVPTSVAYLSRQSIASSLGGLCASPPLLGQDVSTTLTPPVKTVAKGLQGVSVAQLPMQAGGISSIEIALRSYGQTVQVTSGVAAPTSPVSIRGSASASTCGTLATSAALASNACAAQLSDLYPMQVAPLIGQPFAASTGGPFGILIQKPLTSNKIVVALALLDGKPPPAEADWCLVEAAPATLFVGSTPASPLIDV